MAYTLSQRKRMAEIFNEAISKSLFPQYSVTANDFDPAGGLLSVPLINFVTDKDPLTAIFNSAAQNRQVDQGQFFHFKSVDIAKLIIERQLVQVSNLFSNHYNDFAEYTEFFQRTGLLHQLIPSTYAADKKTVNSRKNRPVDEDRDEIFILCVTKEGHTEKFWKEYAKEDTGVCLVLRFLDFDRKAAHTYDFRDVNYDTGYQFEFVNKVNHHFSYEFNRLLFMGGITKFARFYKRGLFEWENETRLAFDYQKGSPHGAFLKTIFPIQVDGDRKFISVPLKGNKVLNPLFTLDIDEVIVGKNVSTADKADLEGLLSTKFPNARLWQREYSNY